MENNKFLIIFIDALRFDYLQKMPRLKKTIKQARYGKTTVELGFASRMGAFFTGRKPVEHGFFTLFYCTKNSDFKWIKAFIPFVKMLSSFKPLEKLLKYITFALMNLASFVKGHHYFFYLKGAPLDLLPFIEIVIKKHYCEKGAFPVPTLFDAFRKKKLKFHFYMWPFYLTNKKVHVELPVSKFNSDQHRLRRFKKILKKDGDVFFAQFFNLDTAGHAFGIKSKQLQEEIKFTDKLIDDLKNDFWSKHPGGNILIWTDHGMTPIKKILNVQKKIDKMKLVPIKDYLYFIDATMVRVWPKNKKAEKVILKELRKTNLVELTPALRKKYDIDYSNEKYGKIIFQAPSGTLLFPNFFECHHSPKAMHGYFPETPTEKGAYVLISPKYSPGYQEKKTRDLYKLVLDIFDVDY